MGDIDPLSLDFATRHPDSFARVLGRGDPEEGARILESLPAERKASIVARLPAARIQQLLNSGQHQPELWLAKAPFDEAVTLLSRIPAERRRALVDAVPDKERLKRLKQHQRYPAHCAGALVGDIPIRLGADSLAADVLAELRDLDADDPGSLVIVDKEGRYLGILDRWRLLMQSPPIGQVGDYLIEVKAVRPETPIVTLVQDEIWHSRHWLPVVDHRQRLLGGVSRQRVFRASGSQMAEAGRSSGGLFDLFDDLVHMFGALLESMLKPRSS